MPTYGTISPTNLIGTEAGSWQAYNTGTATTMSSAVSYLSDSADTTYISPTALGPDDTATVVFNMNSWASVSGSAITVIRIGVRAGYSPNYARGYLSPADDSRVLSDVSWYGSSTSIAGYVGGWATSTNGTAWLDLGDKPLVRLTTSDVNARFSKLYFETKWCSIPTTPTVTIQASTVANPRVQWTYGDGDGNAQSSADVRWFTNAVATAVGFNASTSTYLYATVVAGTYISVAPPGSIVANGDVFRGYVTVVSDKDGVPVASAWGSSVATTAVYATATPPFSPPAPGGTANPSPATQTAATLAGAYQSATRRNQITITGPTNGFYSITRASNDLVGSAYTPITASPTTVNDYIGVRGGTTTYTVKIYTTGSAERQSSTLQVVGSTATTWELLSAANPTTVYDYDLRVTSQTNSQYEGVEVFRPLTSSYPIVLAGEIGAEDGSIEVMTTSAAEYADMTSLMNVQGPLILTSPFLNSDGTNRKWLIRITDRSWTPSNTINSPINRAVLSYVEVDSSGY